MLLLLGLACLTAGLGFLPDIPASLGSSTRRTRLGRERASKPGELRPATMLRTS